MKSYLLSLLAVGVLFSTACTPSQPATRSIVNFDKGWKFNLGDVPNGQDVKMNDTAWRSLNLPHDWSIEGTFDKNNPATPDGGALPGGIGWYRKTFTLPETDKNKNVYIDFDGVYRNSEVWINGHLLGKRPMGYISFRYDLTKYLHFGAEKNIIAVRADNADQPNSRWYSGSGIYRNVWLVTTNEVSIDHWGTYITTSQVSDKSAKVHLQIRVRNTGGKAQTVNVHTTLYDVNGKAVATANTTGLAVKDSLAETAQDFTVSNPTLWSVDNPYLYKAVTTIEANGNKYDDYTTTLGIRYFNFDTDKGFTLNGKHVKINGVCDHHDLGCLGAAINTRALERQLEILKSFGCNAIRTSHNPPAPELLDLCDKMGFIVMDEAFDCWHKQKVKYDYHLYFDAWHKRDLEDMLLRDRNHPSIIMWSIGNEIPEQGDSTGTTIARELASTVKGMDTTRPIVDANNDPYPDNYILKSGAVDLIGYNYDFKDYPTFHTRYPGNKKFIGTETVSAFATRGHYDMPADKIRIWPGKETLNGDTTCSAYDNCAAEWGSTHEQTLKLIMKYDFLSGQFIWTGFDYMGEPTPYKWPARSSYFGIVDLCGFPKDAYYLYQSVWTDKSVLHILPHWNWKDGQKIDVVAYYNNADDVELFLNGKSLGVKKKEGDDMHVMWHVDYAPGTLKAVSHKDGKVVMTSEVKTAGKPAKIVLSVDRNTIKADGADLAYVTVKITDADGNMVPDADNLVQFNITGNGFIAGVDNGLQTSHESFKANHRKAFNGMCLAVVQSKEKAGKINLTATSDGLPAASVEIMTK